MTWTVYTTQEPTELPVEVAELRDHLGLVHTEDDLRLRGLIHAAVEKVEAWTGRRLVTQQVTELHDQFPFRVAFLHVYPISSIVVRYDDVDGVEQTLSADDYYALLNRRPPAVQMRDGNSWPTTERGKLGAVRYELTVGQSVAEVPQTIKHAILMLCEHWYEHGGDEAPASMIESHNGVKSLLRNHKAFLL